MEDISMINSTLKHVQRFTHQGRELKWSSWDSNTPFTDGTTKKANNQHPASNYAFLPSPCPPPPSSSPLHPSSSPLPSCQSRAGADTDRQYPNDLHLIWPRACALRSTGRWRWWSRPLVAVDGALPVVGRTGSGPGPQRPLSLLLLSPVRGHPTTLTDMAPPIGV